MPKPRRPATGFSRKLKSWLLSESACMRALALLDNRFIYRLIRFSEAFSRKPFAILQEKREPAPFEPGSAVFDTCCQ